MKMPSKHPLIRALGTLLLLTLIFPSGVQGIGCADSDPRPAAPDSAPLEFFEATAQNDYVGLKWQTVSELETTGFNLKRAIAPDPSQATQINPVFISGHPGSQNGYGYVFEDRSGLAPGVTYYYWLEHVDLDGTRSLYLDYMVSAAYTGPPPPSSPAVRAVILGNDVQLGWTHLPENTGYEVWRGDQPYIVLGTPASVKLTDLPAPVGGGEMTYTDTKSGSVGDASRNYFYAVRGVNSLGVSTVTGWVGEFDFALTPGN